MFQEQTMKARKVSPADVSKVFSGILTGTSILGMIIMLLLSAFIAALVFARYVLRTEIGGLFDLSVYMLITFPLLTAAYTLRKGKHIGVDILVSKLSDRARAGVEISAYFLALVFVIVLGWRASVWAYQSFVFNSFTISTFPIPKGILISIMVFGSLLLGLEIINILTQKTRFLLSYRVAGTESQRKLVDNPLVYLAILLAGTIIGVILFVEVSPIGGFIFLLLLLLASGIPVFFVLGFCGSIGIYLLAGSPALAQIPVTIYGTLNTFILTAIPIFVLGGIIMERGKIVEEVFKFFGLFAGRFASSLLVVTVLTGAVICATTGSSVGATAVVTATILPILLKRGYKRSIASGVVGGCTMGSLIPPSLALITYGMLTKESVAQLFMATIVPAAIVYSLYILYVVIIDCINKKWLFEGGQVPAQVTQQISLKSKFQISVRAIWGLLAPVIVLGGIYAGVFTPTESAAVLVVYAIIVCVVITRKLSWKDLLWKCAGESAQLSTMILCLIAAGFVFAMTITQLQVTASLAEWAKAAELGSTGFIWFLFLIIFILGMFLPMVTVMITTVPIFYPLAMALGVNGVWLGVFYVLMGEIGGLTPPVGMSLYALVGISGIPMSTVMRGLIPIVFMASVGIVLMFLFPQTVLWLPNTMVQP